MTPTSVHITNRRDTGKDCHILNETLEGKEQVAHQMPVLRITVTKNDRAFKSHIHQCLPYGTLGDCDAGKSTLGLYIDIGPLTQF